MVGVNKYLLDDEEPYEPLRVDPRIEPSSANASQCCAPTATSQAVSRALDELRKTATGTGNVLLPMREALQLRATGGEVAHALRDVWGVYQPTDRF